MNKKKYIIFRLIKSLVELKYTNYFLDSQLIYKKIKQKIFFLKNNTLSI